MLDSKEKLVEMSQKSQMSQMIRRQELRERPAREDILELPCYIDSTRSHMQSEMPSEGMQRRKARVSL